MQEPSHEQLQRWAAEYKAGTISPADKEIFETWLFSEPGREIQWPGAEDMITVKQEMQQHIEEQTRPGKVRRLWTRYAAAASIFIALGLLALYLFNQQPDKPGIAQTNDALPGKEGAILTLADGSQLILDTLKSGIIATDHGNEVSLENGQLSYKNPGNQLSYKNPGDKPEVYNTLTTPKGRIYKLLLSDGTTAWLNSSSSITYPLSFSKDARKVSVTGEVYFEVAPEKKRRFSVSADATTIEVLGTHFNINAYPDEKNISTTLLEGKVRVIRQGNSSILKPGQQAISNRAGNNIKIEEADIEEAMAWKNGFFHFDDTDLETVLRQLSRWYDVDVQYQGAVPDKRLVGEIQKDAKLSEVLKALEYTGVKFHIRGKTIIVNE